MKHSGRESGRRPEPRTCNRCKGHCAHFAASPAGAEDLGEVRGLDGEIGRHQKSRIRRSGLCLFRNVGRTPGPAHATHELKHVPPQTKSVAQGAWMEGIK